MCQHKAPHREWEPALRHLGHDHDRRYPEPATLFDDYSGRGKAEHEQDMTIARTMNDKDLKLVAPPRADRRPAHGLGRLLRAAQRGLSRRPTSRATTWCAGSTIAICTTTWAASRPSTRASAGCWRFSTTRGWRRTRSWSTPPTRASTWASTAGSTSGGSSRSRSARRCWSAGREWSSPAARAAGSSRTSTSPRRSWTPPGCPCPPRCRGEACCRCSAGKEPADWRTSFYYHYYEYPGPHNVRRHYGVVTDRYKLVHFYEPEMNYWELFDLETDPRELRSVYGQPGQARVQEELSRELARLRKVLNVPSPDPPESMIPRRGQRAGG